MRSIFRGGVDPYSRPRQLKSIPLIATRKLKRSGQTSEAIFRRLVEDIVTGALPAGEPLRESSLATSWKVSRTPVREAVRRAAALGLLELRPNRRPLVRSLSPEDVTKLLVARSAMELLAYELAVDNLKDSPLVESLWHEAVYLSKSPDQPAWKRRALALDDAMHRLWIDACQNPWLQVALEPLWVFIRILQRVAARDKALAFLACREHCSILSAIHSGDFPAGQKLLAAHIQSATAKLKEHLIEYETSALSGNPIGPVASRP